MARFRFSTAASLTVGLLVLNAVLGATAWFDAPTLTSVQRRASARGAPLPSLAVCAHSGGSFVATAGSTRTFPRSNATARLAEAPAFHDDPSDDAAASFWSGLGSCGGHVDPLGSGPREQWGGVDPASISWAAREGGVAGLVDPGAGAAEVFSVLGEADPSALGICGAVAARGSWMRNASLAPIPSIAAASARVEVCSPSKQPGDRFEGTGCDPSHAERVPGAGMFGSVLPADPRAIDYETGSPFVMVTTTSASPGNFSVGAVLAEEAGTRRAGGAVSARAANLELLAPSWFAFVPLVDPDPSHGHVADTFADGSGGYHASPPGDAAAAAPLRAGSLRSVACAGAHGFDHEGGAMGASASPASGAGGFGLPHPASGDPSEYPHAASLAPITDPGRFEPGPASPAWLPHEYAVRNASSLPSSSVGAVVLAAGTLPGPYLADSFGNATITGDSAGYAELRDAANGTVLWRAVVDSDGADHATSIASDASSGRVFVAVLVAGPSATVTVATGALGDSTSWSGTSGSLVLFALDGMSGAAEAAFSIFEPSAGSRRWWTGSGTARDGTPPTSITVDAAAVTAATTLSAGATGDVRGENATQPSAAIDAAPRSGAVLLARFGKSPGSSRSWAAVLDGHVTGPVAAASMTTANPDAPAGTSGLVVVAASAVDAGGDVFPHAAAPHPTLNVTRFGAPGAASAVDENGLVAFGRPANGSTAVPDEPGVAGRLRTRCAVVALDRDTGALVSASLTAHGSANGTCGVAGIEAPGTRPGDRFADGSGSVDGERPSNLVVVAGEEFAQVFRTSRDAAQTEFGGAFPSAAAADVGAAPVSAPFVAVYDPVAGGFVDVKRVAVSDNDDSAVRSPAAASAAARSHPSVPASAVAVSGVAILDPVAHGVSAVLSGFTSVFGEDAALSLDDDASSNETIATPSHLEFSLDSDSSPPFTVGGEAGFSLLLQRPALGSPIASSGFAPGLNITNPFNPLGGALRCWPNPPQPEPYHSITMAVPFPNTAPTAITMRGLDARPVPLAARHVHAVVSGAVLPGTQTQCVDRFGGGALYQPSGNVSGIFNSTMTEDPVAYIPSGGDATAFALRENAEVRLCATYDGFHDAAPAVGTGAFDVVVAGGDASLFGSEVRAARVAFATPDPDPPLAEFAEPCAGQFLNIPEDASTIARASLWSHGAGPTSMNFTLGPELISEGALLTAAITDSCAYDGAAEAARWSTERVDAKGAPWTTAEAPAGPGAERWPASLQGFMCPPPSFHAAVRIGTSDPTHSFPGVHVSSEIIIDARVDADVAPAGGIVTGTASIPVNVTEGHEAAIRAPANPGFFLEDNPGNLQVFPVPVPRLTLTAVRLGSAAAADVVLNATLASPSLGIPEIACEYAPSSGSFTGFATVLTGAAPTGVVIDAATADAWRTEHAFVCTTPRYADLPAAVARQSWPAYGYVNITASSADPHYDGIYLTLNVTIGLWWSGLETLGRGPVLAVAVPTESTSAAPPSRTGGTYTVTGDGGETSVIVHALEGVSDAGLEVFLGRLVGGNVTVSCVSHDPASATCSPSPAAELVSERDYFGLSSPPPAGVSFAMVPVDDAVTDETGHHDVSMTVEVVSVDDPSQRGYLNVTLRISDDDTESRNFDVDWAFSSRTVADSRSNSMSSIAALATARDGSLAIAGMFHGAVRLGSGALLHSGSSTRRAAFVSVVESDSAIRWVRAVVWAPGSPDKRLSVASVAVDHSSPDNDVVVLFEANAGKGASVDLIGPTGNVTVTFSETGNGDLILARYAGTDGRVLWARELRSRGVERAASVSVVPDGSIVVAGSFGECCLAFAFGPDPYSDGNLYLGGVTVATREPVSMDTRSEAFASVFSSTGTAIRAVTAGGPGEQYAAGAVPIGGADVLGTGDLYLAGSATHPGASDPAPLRFGSTLSVPVTTSEPVPPALFVAKSTTGDTVSWAILSTDGSTDPSRSCGTPAGLTRGVTFDPTSVAQGRAGAVFVAGTFTAARGCNVELWRHDAGSGTPTLVHNTTMLEEGEARRAFVAKISTSGTVEFFTYSKGTLSIKVGSVVADVDRSQIHLAGVYVGGFAWRAASGDLTLPYHTMQEIFSIALSDDTGEVVWVDSAGGHGNAQGDVQGAVGPSGIMYLAGSYSAQTVFGGKNVTVATTGTPEGFVAKAGVPTIVASSLVLDIVEGSTATYTVALGTQPRATVVVTVDPETPSPLSLVSPGFLTFTGLNWNIPQTVTLSAQNNMFLQIDTGFRVTHEAASIDVGYDGLLGDVVKAIVKDDGDPLPFSFARTPEVAFIGHPAQTVPSYMTITVPGSPRADLIIEAPSTAPIGGAPPTLSVTPDGLSADLAFTPSAVNLGSVPVSVELVYSEFGYRTPPASFAISIQEMPGPVVTAVSPRIVHYAGGDPVTVYGANFHDGDPSLSAPNVTSLSFAGVPCAVAPVWSDPQTITCPSVAAATGNGTVALTGPVAVEISRSYGPAGPKNSLATAGAPSPPVAITFRPTSLATSVAPAAMPSASAARLLIRGVHLCHDASDVTSVSLHLGASTIVPCEDRVTWHNDTAVSCSLHANASVAARVHAAADGRARAAVAVNCATTGAGSSTAPEVARVDLLYPRAVAVWPDAVGIADPTAEVTVAVDNVDLDGRFSPPADGIASIAVADRECAVSAAAACTAADVARADAAAAAAGLAARPDAAAPLLCAVCTIAANESDPLQTSVLATGTPAREVVGVVSVLGSFADVLDAASITFEPPAPVVLSVVPTIVPASGGAVVTVRGEHFGPASLEPTLRLAGIECVPQTYVSSTEMLCVTPDVTAQVQATGSVLLSGSVTVTTPAPGSLVGSSAESVSFIFTTDASLVPPRASEVIPGRGPMTGGNVVAIVGHSFGADPGAFPARETGIGGAGSWVTRVIVGKFSCSSTLVFVSATRLECEVPAVDSLPAAPVPVLVTTTVGDSTYVPAYEYTYPRTSVIGMFPRLGDPAGSERVTLVGSWFGPDASSEASIAVWISGSPCVSVRWISETSVSCTTPPSATTAPPGDPTVISVFRTSTTAADVDREDLGFRYASSASALCVPSCPFNADCVGGTCQCAAGFTGLPACDQSVLSATLAVRVTQEVATADDAGEAELELVLRRAPTATVTVPLSVSTEREATLSQSTVVFTPSDFSATQTVTVTGQYDAVRDGPSRYALEISALVSEDTHFHGHNPGDFILLSEETRPRITAISDEVMPLNGSTVVIDVADLDDGNVTVIFTVRTEEGAVEAVYPVPVVPLSGTPAAQIAGVAGAATRDEDHVTRDGEVFIPAPARRSRFFSLRSAVSPAAGGGGAGEVFDGPEGSEGFEGRSRSDLALEQAPTLGTVGPDQGRADGRIAPRFAVRVTPPPMRHEGMHADIQVVAERTGLTTASIDRALFLTDDCPEPGQFGRGADCEPCPEGAECPGGYRMWPLKGYWTPNERAGYVIPCVPSARCLGTELSLCAEGYQGDVCGECQDGYVEVGNICERCPSPEGYWAYFVANLVVWGLITLSTWTLEDREQMSLVLAAVISFQNVAAVGQAIDDSMPKLVRDVYSFLILFAGDVRFVRASCVGDPVPVGPDYFVSLAYNLAMGVPMIFGTLAVRWFSVRRHIARGTGREEERRLFWMARFKRAMLVHITIVWFSVVSQSLRVVSCFRVDAADGADPGSGGGWRLTDNPSYPCYTAKHIGIIIPAYLVLLFVGVGYPVGYYYLVMVRNRSRLYSKSSTLTFRNAYDVLYEPFRWKHRNAWVFEFTTSLGLALAETSLTRHPLEAFVVVMVVFGTQLVYFALPQPPHRRSWEARLMMLVTAANMFGACAVYLSRLEKITDDGRIVLIWIMMVLLGIDFMAMAFVMMNFVVFRNLTKKGRGRKGRRGSDQSDGTVASSYSGDEYSLDIARDAAAARGDSLPYGEDPEEIVIASAGSGSGPSKSGSSGSLSGYAARTPGQPDGEVPVDEESLFSVIGGTMSRVVNSIRRAISYDNVPPPAETVTSDPSNAERTSSDDRDGYGRRAPSQAGDSGMPDLVVDGDSRPNSEPFALSSSHGSEDGRSTRSTRSGRSTRRLII